MAEADVVQSIGPPLKLPEGSHVKSSQLFFAFVLSQIAIVEWQSLEARFKFYLALMKRCLLGYDAGPVQLYLLFHFSWT